MSDADWLARVDPVVLDLTRATIQERMRPGVQFWGVECGPLADRYEEIGLVDVAEQAKDRCYTNAFARYLRLLGASHHEANSYCDQLVIDARYRQSPAPLADQGFGPAAFFARRGESGPDG